MRAGEAPIDPGTRPDSVADAREGTGAPHPGRVRGVVGQWPLLLVMALAWGALWQDFGLHVLLAGLMFAVLVTVLFPLPPIPFSGRLHPWPALVFAVRFLADAAASSVSVAAAILRRGHRVRSSVVAVPLRSRDDLVVTLVSHALALVPGSIVLDVDRASRVLYLHCLDTTTPAQARRHREKALRVEALVIRAVGSAADLELLRRHPDAAPPPEAPAPPTPQEER